MDKIKLYDGKLTLAKKLDGSVVITRESVFKYRTHEIATFTNQYVGSQRWIVEKLKSMDSTRHDFFTKSIQKNLEMIRGTKDDRIHRDVADFMRNGNQFVG